MLNCSSQCCSMFPLTLPSLGLTLQFWQGFKKLWFMEDFKDLQKFHWDCGRRILVPHVPMYVSESIWRLLSFSFRNVRKSAVEKIWEPNPCAWGEALRRAKSICHWKQQGPSWLLWHPFRSHSSTEWFSWPGVLFLYRDHSLTLMGLRYRLYKQQTPQKSSASPGSRNPQTTYG